MFEEMYMTGPGFPIPQFRQGFSYRDAGAIDAPQFLPTGGMVDENSPVVARDEE